MQLNLTSVPAFIFVFFFLASWQDTHTLLLSRPSSQARSLYPVSIFVGWRCFPPDKTTLGFNDLEVDRWAPCSDLSARACITGLAFCAVCPAVADWSSAHSVTLTLDIIICAWHWPTINLFFLQWKLPTGPRKSSVKLLLSLLAYGK